jgi:hypothetical protein
MMTLKQLTTVKDHPSAANTFQSMQRRWTNNNNHSFDTWTPEIHQIFNPSLSCTFILVELSSFSLDCDHLLNLEHERTGR